VFIKSRRSEKIVTVVQRPTHEPVGASNGQKSTDTSMLDFYVNRASRSLSACERAGLEKVKAALKAPPAKTPK